MRSDVHRSYVRLPFYENVYEYDYYYHQEYEKIIKDEIYYDFLSRQEYEKIIKDERRNRKFAKREKRKTKTKSKKSENKPGKNSGRKTINENSARKIKHYDRKTMELLNFL